MEVFIAICNSAFDIVFLLLFILGWCIAILAVQKYTELEEQLEKEKERNAPVKKVTFQVSKETDMEKLGEFIKMFIEAGQAVNVTEKEAVNADDGTDNRDN